jgi:FkbM family methyltransferase
MVSSPTQPLPLPPALAFLRRRDFPRKLGLLERLFGAGLSLSGESWVRTAAGPVWLLDLTNETHRWIVYGDYEGPAFWNWVRASRDRLHTVVDSGANIGQTVLHFSTYLPDALILAYEPGTAARRWLEESVQANQPARIEVLPWGLGPAPGTARLAERGPTNRHGAWNRVVADDGEPIRLVTLDGELERRGLAALDLWKLDLEGFEVPALEGAAAALAAHRIRAVYVELADQRDAIRQVLTGHGYTIHGLSRTGRLIPWQQHHTHDCALFLAPGW